MECCHDIGITVREFRMLSARDQAYHLAYMSAKQKMSAVESFDDWRRDKIMERR